MVSVLILVILIVSKGSEDFVEKLGDNIKKLNNLSKDRALKQQEATK